MTDLKPELVMRPRPYPPAPWTLRGTALGATFAVRAAAVAHLVPAPLKLVNLPGGLALGYLGVGRYGPGSTLEYSELIAGVLVRYGLRVGPFVTHIAVDDARSQRAGRELWHLPKVLWQFEWNLDAPQLSVQVWDDNRLVCRISQVPPTVRFLPLRLRMPFLNTIEDSAALLIGDGDVRVAQAPWQLQLVADGPLAPFQPVSPLLTMAVKGCVHVAPLQPLE